MFLPLVRMHNNVEWNQPIGLYILQLGQQQSANQTAGYHILETSGSLPRSRHSISAKVGRSASHDNDTWCIYGSHCMIKPLASSHAISVTSSHTLYHKLSKVLVAHFNLHSLHDVGIHLRYQYAVEQVSFEPFAISEVHAWQQFVSLIRHDQYRSSDHRGVPSTRLLPAVILLMIFHVNFTHNNYLHAYHQHNHYRWVL